ncbi:MAG: hypothetical protein OXL37_13040 [Chloroflexota bacterium]|nr:hypothetical protein [Chloroflexota bacterium]MDE2959182.1 hypothetical protein [Chloroflexota bacterium]
MQSRFEELAPDPVNGSYRIPDETRDEGQGLSVFSFAIVSGAWESG